MPKVVSIIPARGGSKGIPNKNIIDLNGKPLISYAINASLGSIVDETWVSTDNNEIANVSREFGASVLPRPAELAQDNSSTEDAIKHFLDNVYCDICVLIQATSPLVKSSDIDSGVVLVKSGEYDSVFSSVKSNDILVWNEYYSPINYDMNQRGNRQTRNQSIIIETGSVYVFTSSYFKATNNRLHGRIGSFLVPFWRSFEIDCYEDLENIRKLMG